jgi:hypothetical protein
MDVHMTPQDAGMARSFWLILSALFELGLTDTLLPPRSLCVKGISERLTKKGGGMRVDAGSWEVCAFREIFPET